MFYEFDDEHNLFLIVLDLSPSIMISTPWSISLVDGGVARKSCLLTFWLGPIAKYVHFR